MRFANCILTVLAAAVVLSCGGCVSAARNTEGFAKIESVMVDAPYSQTWQAVKAVLREEKVDIYTRDKRGMFVAFTKMHRFMLVQPRRVKYTITIKPRSETSTDVTIETVKQLYGVTLLTYPNWHDRPATKDVEGTKMLAKIQEKVAMAAAAPSAAPSDVAVK